MNSYKAKDCICNQALQSPVVQGGCSFECEADFPSVSAEVLQGHRDWEAGSHPQIGTVSVSRGLGEIWAELTICDESVKCDGGCGVAMAQEEMHQMNGVTSPWRYWKAVTGEHDDDTEQPSNDFSFCQNQTACQNFGRQDSDR